MDGWSKGGKKSNKLCFQVICVSSIINRNEGALPGWVRDHVRCFHKLSIRT